jgi:hypothetical protein
VEHGGAQYGPCAGPERAELAGPLQVSLPWAPASYSAPYSPDILPRAQGCSWRVPSRHGSWKQLKSLCPCSCTKSVEKTRGSVGEARPLGPALSQLLLTFRAVVKVQVSQEHAEGHLLTTLSALSLKLLSPVQQQRQLFAAQAPVLYRVQGCAARLSPGCEFASWTSGFPPCSDLNPTRLCLGQ